MSFAFDLRAHTHLLVVAGSRAHGLAGPDSDVDLKGVAVPPRRYILGFTRSFEQADQPGDMTCFSGDLAAPERSAAAQHGLEGTVYSLRKFLALAAGANPNILETLFCREEEVRRCTPTGERLVASRELFLTARCVQTFTGYASDQLRRMRRHHRWHRDGPPPEPTRAAFELPEVGLVPRDHRLAVEAAVARQLEAWEVDLAGVEPATRVRLEERLASTLASWKLATEEDRWAAAARHLGLDDDLIAVMQRERAYQSARAEFKRFETWKTQRNPARAALEATHGYDTKHAAHLVRLLRMGLEIGRDGRCIVWRGDRDAEELRAIRAGAWTYEALVAWADERTRELRALDDLAVPDSPDYEAIDALCVALSEASLA